LESWTSWARRATALTMLQATKIEAKVDKIHFKMPDQTTLGPPTLRVRELQSTLDFYEKDLGLKVQRRFRDPSDSLDLVQLGFQNNTDSILFLKHDPNAKRTPHSFAGLYHYAVLVPDRKSLALTYLAIGNRGVVYEGFADHGFSEALYLRDNERNGIEIYADRPRNVWPQWNQMISALKAGDPYALEAMQRPLELESLIRELGTDERARPASFPFGARIGHMHLRVTNLEKSVKFYHEKLGFDVGAYLPEIGAAFLTVAGYHHRLGLNTWHSLNGKTHAKGEAGLENFLVHVPNRTSIEEIGEQFKGSVSDIGDSQISLLDPDGIQIVIRAGR
jgi:catechol 2,3-dioxygenase